MPLTKPVKFLVRKKCRIVDSAKSMWKRKMKKKNLLKINPEDFEKNKKFIVKSVILDYHIKEIEEKLKRTKQGSNEYNKIKEILTRRRIKYGFLNNRIKMFELSVLRPLGLLRRFHEIRMERIIKHK